MIRRSLSYKVTPEDERYRIRTILGMRLGVSTRFLRACRNDGDILLNGEHVRTVDPARAGDTLTLVFPKTEPPADVPPEEIPLRVLYEDEDFLAVRKPAGIPVHPSKGHPSGTLLNAIVNKIREDEREGRSDAYEPHLINRLDKDTSGVVLTGKNAYVQDAFAELAKRGAVEKTYRAVVRGIPEPAERTIDRPIGQPDPLKVGRAVVPEEEGGYPSRTRYRTLKTFRVSDDETYALLECTLETGRTHQIRVHLSSIGCPIAGDALYGPKDGTARPLPITRQALCATRLAFDHPVTGRRIVIDAEPDGDIEELLNELETESSGETGRRAAPLRPLRLETGNIRRVTAGRGGEAILLLGGEKTALYDSGMAYCAEEMLENLDRALNGRPLDYFLVSHIHYDHIGALPYIRMRHPETEVLGHEHAKRQIVKPHKYAQIRELSEDAAKTFCGPDGTIPPYDDSLWCVDRVIRDGDEIGLGGVTLRVMETPGHTKDCLAFYVPEWDLLIASETTGVWEASGVNVVEFLTGYDESVRAFERCRALGAKHVLSPHTLEIAPEDIPRYWECGLDYLAGFRADIERELAKTELTDDQRVADLAAKYWVGMTQEDQPYPAFAANANAQIYTIRKLLEQT